MRSLLIFIPILPHIKDLCDSKLHKKINIVKSNKENQKLFQNRAKKTKEKFRKNVLLASKIGIYAVKFFRILVLLKIKREKNEKKKNY